MLTPEDVNTINQEDRAYTHWLKEVTNKAIDMNRLHPGKGTTYFRSKVGPVFVMTDDYLTGNVY